MEDITNVEVKKYWESNPIHSIEYGTIDSIKEYCKEVDNLRWTEHERWAEAEFHDFKAKQSAKLLDVGCGIGVFTRYYARKGYSVSGIDISKTAVNITNASLKAFGLEGNIKQSSAEKIPFKNNCFDYISSNGVIHHTENTEQAVAEIYRVLKPGGKAMISVYFRNILLNPIFFILTKNIFNLIIIPGKLKGREKFLDVKSPEDFVKVYDGNKTPIARVYSKKEVKKLLKEFKIIKMEPHYFPIRFFKIFKLGGLLHKLLDKHFGTLMYCLIEKPYQTDK